VNTILVSRMKGTELVIIFNRSVFSMQHSLHISSSSVMIDDNLCSDFSKMFNYKLRGRTDDDIIIIIIIIIIITRCYQYIQRCKQSLLVNPNNMTVISTFPAAVITVSLNSQTPPTSEEFGDRGGHNPIMQYSSKDTEVEL